MRAFKPLLAIDGVTLLDRAIQLFARCAGPLVVVAGHQAANIADHLVGTETRLVVNAQYREGMFSSIRAGAAALKDDCQAFFLLPVDIPMVNPTTVEALLAARARDNSFLVYHPVHAGRKGHPPLIDTGLVESLLLYQGEDGMRGFLRAHASHAKHVEVDDPHIHLDVDTRAQLKRLQRLSG
jgi:CTP:molybdopterin cytidylyltransferase MocA